MKRVLGVVGSPRKKGNTHMLVSRILEGSEAGGAEVDILHLPNDAIHHRYEKVEA